jgi:FtsP/CotA-like multicopper oxidase with cupredoxin domain
VVLARFRAGGKAVNSKVLDRPVLRAGRMPMPDLGSAQRLAFDLAATATGARLVTRDDEFSSIVMDSLCLSQQSFWAMNKQSWPRGDHARLPPPLMVLRQGRSYVVENLSQVRHPIHLHGHSFLVLGSNRRALPVYWADTVLVAPRERVEIAFLADNPGNWMFHCHLIEHQEAGMMGYLRIA